jgi:hypothetical protein
MSMPCSICPHPQRSAIDRGLIAGESIRGMARRYGVSASSIARHRDSHLTAALAKTVETARLEISADKLTDWTGSLHAKTMRLLARAEEMDDLANARGLIREARENLVLLGRLAGVIDGPTVHVDARRQVAVLGNLTEAELRRLAAGADVIDAEPVAELAA